MEEQNEISIELVAEELSEQVISFNCVNSIGTFGSSIGGCASTVGSASSNSSSY